jgi:hypothetical protein
VVEVLQITPTISGGGIKDGYLDITHLQLSFFCLYIRREYCVKLGFFCPLSEASNVLQVIVDCSQKIVETR